MKVSPLLKKKVLKRVPLRELNVISHLLVQRSAKRGVDLGKCIAFPHLLSTFAEDVSLEQGSHNTRGKVHTRVVHL